MVFCANYLDESEHEDSFPGNFRRAYMSVTRHIISLKFKLVKCTQVSFTNHNLNPYSTHSTNPNHSNRMIQNHLSLGQISPQHHQNNAMFINTMHPSACAMLTDLSISCFLLTGGYRHVFHV